MQNATLTNHKIAIEGMTGDVCVQKVTTALKGVPDVTTQSVKVGSATISADDTGCKAACSAIEAAGYKAHEDKNNSPNGAPKASTDTKPSGQSQSMNANGPGKTQQNNDKNAAKPGATPNSAESKPAIQLPGNSPATPAKVGT